jgi:hypothetical protein
MMMRSARAWLGVSLLLVGCGGAVAPTIGDVTDEDAGDGLAPGAPPITPPPPGQPADGSVAPPGEPTDSSIAPPPGFPPDASVPAPDASVKPPPVVDAAPPPVITCGATSCSPTSQECCFTGGGGASCVPQGKCQGIAIQCSSAASCTGGEVCCAAGGNGGSPTATCAPACTGGPQLCASDDECQNGGACRPLGKSGVAICRRPRGPRDGGVSASDAAFGGD